MRYGKEAMSGIPVIMKGKLPGVEYHYLRYVHYIKARKRLPKRKYCYVRQLATEARLPPAFRRNLVTTSRALA